MIRSIATKITEKESGISGRRAVILDDSLTREDGANE